MTSGEPFVLGSRALVGGVGDAHAGGVKPLRMSRTAGLGAATAALLLAVAAVLAWQQAFWPLNQTSAKALERRAQYFWDLRLSGDVLGAYEYMIEPYRRRVGASGFARAGGIVTWTGARVKGVELDEKGGLVQLELKYRISEPKFSSIESLATVKERWVLEEGAWHRWPPEMGG